MKKSLIVLFLLFGITASALAHGGHQHNFLGTVKAHQDKDLVITTVGKKEVTFTLTEKTKLLKGTKPAEKSDLKPGVRVSVSVENDGKTATVVKIGKQE